MNNNCNNYNENRVPSIFLPKNLYIIIVIIILLCRFTSSCISIIHIFVEEKIMLENSEERIKLLKKGLTEKQIEKLYLEKNNSKLWDLLSFLSCWNRWKTKWEKLVEVRSGSLNMHYRKKISKWMSEGIKMEIEISVPDMITLKGDKSERSIRLENCHNQDDVMDYLKICLSLYSVNYPDRTVESESAVPILNLNRCYS